MIGNDVLVDSELVGSIKFGGTRTPHQWNSGGVPNDVVMVLERHNGPRWLRDLDDDVSARMLFSWCDDGDVHASLLYQLYGHLMPCTSCLNCSGI